MKRRFNVRFKTTPVYLELEPFKDFLEHIPFSLVNFLRVYEKHAMTVYKALLSDKRVLVLGSKSSVWEVICTTCGLARLVKPLKGLLEFHLHPYVNLEDLSFLSRVYVAGAANPVFRVNSEWWDLLLDLDESTTSTNYTQELTEQDQCFLSRVLLDLDNHTEDTLRLEFIKYTQNLISAENRTLLYKYFKASNCSEPSEVYRFSMQAMLKQATEDSSSLLAVYEKLNNQLTDENSKLELVNILSQENFILGALDLDDEGVVLIVFTILYKIQQLPQAKELLRKLHKHHLKKYKLFKNNLK